MVERSTNSTQWNQHILFESQFSISRDTWQAICPRGIKSIIPIQSQHRFQGKKLSVRTVLDSRVGILRPRDVLRLKARSTVEMELQEIYVRAEVDD